MNRRHVISALFTASVLPGCSTLQPQHDSMQFEINAANLYRLENGGFVTVVHLDRRGKQDEKRTVHLRWEFVSKSDGVRWAIDQRFVIDTEAVDPKVTLSWMPGGDEAEDGVRDSRVKITRRPERDSDWVATERNPNSRSD
ncbi:hypothetical protein [Halorussus sp. MSC15.2]|uniref:hypothetical protein n=1 Tax=Halorussus sp. MSC15.2 TaxID=2283638 RepID=UPI0013D528F7|nr:hypothetical protein [Halorussus sp. MSC15.2]NEU55733.1 hypothetical protein [Halorussus sp. MSC15.2]